MSEQPAAGERPGPEVVVVGSINLDLSLTVERFPEPGETVLGLDLLRGGGGKGANQAVAAARLGRRVAMVGAVGNDDTGALLLRKLQAEGVDLDRIDIIDGVPSGLAVIEVEQSGENRIVVISGANAAIEPSHVERVADVVAAAPVVLTQFEVPGSVVERLAGMERAGRLVLNPAPAQFVLNLAGVDVLVPNRGELALLAGAGPLGASGDTPPTTDELVDQARSIGDDLEAVVVTLGGDGALVIDGLRTGSVSVNAVEPVPVEPVDTTGAGDAFCGGLADGLCLGADVLEAARWAAKVAAVTVTRRGAQDSLPRRSDVLS
jgi:ribokinase